jgi:hypothetical protein
VPVTEANLGDGVFDTTDFLARGGRFGVGSDSLIRVSAAEELRLLEYARRLRHGAGISTGRGLFEAALAGGAEALGRRIGALAPGTAPTSWRSTQNTPRSRRRAATSSSTPESSQPTTPLCGTCGAAASRW